MSYSLIKKKRIPRQEFHPFHPLQRSGSEFPDRFSIEPGFIYNPGEEEKELPSPYVEPEEGEWINIGNQKILVQTPSIVGSRHLDWNTTIDALFHTPEFERVLEIVRDVNKKNLWQRMVKEANPEEIYGWILQYFGDRDPSDQTAAHLIYTYNALRATQRNAFISQILFAALKETIESNYLPSLQKRTRWPVLSTIIEMFQSPQPSALDAANRLRKRFREDFWTFAPKAWLDVGEIRLYDLRDYAFPELQQWREEYVPALSEQEFQFLIGDFNASIRDYDTYVLMNEINLRKSAIYNRKVIGALTVSGILAQFLAFAAFSAISGRYNPSVNYNPTQESTNLIPLGFNFTYSSFAQSVNRKEPSVSSIHPLEERDFSYSEIRQKRSLGDAFVPFYSEDTLLPAFQEQLSNEIADSFRYLLGGELTFGDSLYKLLGSTLLEKQGWSIEQWDRYFHDIQKEEYLDYPGNLARYEKEQKWVSTLTKGIGKLVKIGANYLGVGDELQSWQNNADLFLGEYKNAEVAKYILEHWYELQTAISFLDDPIETANDPRKRFILYKTFRDLPGWFSGITDRVNLRNAKKTDWLKNKETQFFEHFYKASQSETTPTSREESQYMQNLSRFWKLIETQHSTGPMTKNAIASSRIRQLATLLQNRNNADSSDYKHLYSLYDDSSIRGEDIAVLMQNLLTKPDQLHGAMTILGVDSHTKQRILGEQSKYQNEYDERSRQRIHPKEKIIFKDDNTMETPDHAFVTQVRDWAISLPAVLEEFVHRSAARAIVAQVQHMDDFSFPEELE